MITALQLIDDLRDALNTVDTDKLNVHIKSTDVSAGDASAANQTTMITALQILDNLVGALNSIGTDKIDVHIKSTDLSAGDASAANQTTMITALQLIDDLRGALGSVNTDDLQVDVKTAPTTTVQSLNSDKIWAYSDILRQEIEDLNLSTGLNSIDGPTVPAGEIWIITNLTLYYSGTTPNLIYARIDDTSDLYYLAKVETPSNNFYYPFNINHVAMVEGDHMELVINDATLNDNARLRYQGYIMQI